MKVLSALCRSENDRSRDKCSVCGTTDPNAKDRSSPIPPWWRRPYPGSDIVAAALGSIFLFGGVTNLRLALFVVDLLWEIQAELGELLFLMLMGYAFQLIVLVSLCGTLVTCIVRTRTIIGGLVATAVASTTIIVGAYALLWLSARNPCRNWLLFLSYPGEVARDYLNPQWGYVITVIQIVIALVLLNFFRRARPTRETAGRSSPPPPPKTTGDGQHKNA
jgi:hypothetical protein